MNADPHDYLSRPEDWLRSCESCGSTSLTSGRLMTNGMDRVFMFACDSCGDFWFERSGTRLTAAGMRELGLLQG
ncbi:MAG: hypothetical protein E6G68_08390 [Actinobacteria bacterium]|nr:MAG: hypothetical protein E6G68_08390 [Actinomycetota bacterium]